MIRGFVKLKKKKNPTKTRRWVGVSGPNSDFLFFGKIVFSVLFYLLLYMFLKIIVKKLMGGGGVGGYGLDNLFLGFLDFLKLDKTPNVKTHIVAVQPTF